MLKWASLEMALPFVLIFCALPARAGSQRDMVCQGSCGGGCGPCPSGPGFRRERAPSAAEVAWQQASDINDQGLAASDAAQNARFAGDDEGSLAQYQRALELYQQAEQIYSTATHRDNIAMAKGEVAAQRGRIALKNKDYEAAIREFRGAYAAYSFKPWHDKAEELEQWLKDQQAADARQKKTQEALSRLTDTASQAQVEAPAAGSTLEFKSEGASSTEPADAGSTSLADARKVPTGLPSFVAAEIPATPAGDRVRKGFQAIVDHDWNAAHAWFQDALNHDPSNAGIARLVDLADYTMKREKKPAAGPLVDDRAAKAAMDRELDKQMNADEAQSIKDRAAMDAANREMDKQMNADEAQSNKDRAATDREMDKQMNAELSRALDDYNSKHPGPAPTSASDNWKALWHALFDPPKRKLIPQSVSGVRD